MAGSSSVPNSCARALHSAGARGTGRFGSSRRCREVGDAVRALGAGREKATDPVDPTWWRRFPEARGELAGQGELIAEVHAADRGRAEGGGRRIAAAYRYSPRKTSPPEMILGRIT